MNRLNAMKFQADITFAICLALGIVLIIGVFQLLFKAVGVIFVSLKETFKILWSLI